MHDKGGLIIFSGVSRMTLTAFANSGNEIGIGMQLAWNCWEKVDAPVSLELRCVSLIFVRVHLYPNLCFVPIEDLKVWSCWGAGKIPIFLLF